MNKNSNSYIIIYATVMVVVVALILSFASLSLQPRQKANEENEMKGAILLSVGEGSEMNNVKDKTEYINEQYDKYITSSFAVSAAGDVVEGRDAFEILKDLTREYDKPENERELPVFVYTGGNGTVKYILPLRGTGLWGPIWGYVAMEQDWSTISGAVFDHKGETPGLGAEIATPAFEGQFSGKSIFNGDQLVGVSVLKGTGVSAGNPNAVDAVSGGTITSRAVEDMIKNSLNGYSAYIVKQKAGHSPMPGEVDLEVEHGAIELTGESTPEFPATDDQPDNMQRDE